MDISWTWHGSLSWANWKVPIIRIRHVISLHHYKRIVWLLVAWENFQGQLILWLAENNDQAQKQENKSINKQETTKKIDRQTDKQTSKRTFKKANKTTNFKTDGIAKIYIIWRTKIKHQSTSTTTTTTINNHNNNHNNNSYISLSSQKKVRWSGGNNRAPPEKLKFTNTTKQTHQITKQMSAKQTKIKKKREHHDTTTRK